MSVAWQNPKIVGAPRNEHGTRLSQRVECSKCNKTDYVPVKLDKAKAAFCRECAEKLLFAYDQGRHIAQREISCRCAQCHRDFAMAEDIAQKKQEPLCPDCYRGFDVWRGKAAVSKNSRSILTKIGSHTIRKIIDDAV